MISVKMAQPAYGNGFVSLFLYELGKRDSPRYPERNWHVSLREADFASRKETIRRTTLEHYNLTGVQHRFERPELPPGDRSPEIRELDRHCNAFLTKRGIPVDFHRY